MRSKARARKLAKSRLFRFFRRTSFSFFAPFTARVAFPPPAQKLPTRPPPRPCHLSYLHESSDNICPRLELFCSGDWFPCMHRSWLRCFPRRHKLSRVMGSAAGALPDFAPAGRESPPSEYFNSIFSSCCVRVCLCVCASPPVFGKS